MISKHTSDPEIELPTHNHVKTWTSIEISDRRKAKEGRKMFSAGAKQREFESRSNALQLTDDADYLTAKITIVYKYENQAMRCELYKRSENGACTKPGKQ